MNRTLVWQIVWRYLRGKRTANAVPLLSRISMIAIGVASCAMIVLLSVFNGLVGVVQDSYTAFYPDMRIVPQKGKFFSLEPEQLQQIKKINGIALITTTLEDNVLMNNAGKDNQVVTVKGVDKDYFTVNNIAPFISEGNKTITNQGAPEGIVGASIMAMMGMVLNQGINTITLYYPNVNSTSAANPMSAFTTITLTPTGQFTGLQEFDSKYILASLPLVQGLFQAEGQYSAIELKLSEGTDESDVKEQLQKITGPDYKLESRYEQNQTAYTIMIMEKWAMYAILILVLIIASFNMIGALSLLVLEKGKDISILRAMGAEPSTIKGIFLGEGMLWTMVGGMAGLVLGFIICIGQQQFEVVKMEGFVVDSFPVVIKFTDFLLIIFTLLIVGLLASWRPSQKAVKMTTIH